MSGWVRLVNSLRQNATNFAVLYIFTTKSVTGNFDDLMIPSSLPAIYLFIFYLSCQSSLIQILSVISVYIIVFTPSFSLVVPVFVATLYRKEKNLAVMISFFRSNKDFLIKFMRRKLPCSPQISEFFNQNALLILHDYSIRAKLRKTHTTVGIIFTNNSRSPTTP